jgi:hypothetical protein
MSKQISIPPSEPRSVCICANARQQEIVSDAFYISRQMGRWQSSKPAHLGMLETLTTVNVTDLMFDGSITTMIAVVLIALTVSCWEIADIDDIGCARGRAAPNSVAARLVLGCDD